jgi:transcription-repair coupling factor (superfamily II helicase)
VGLDLYCSLLEEAVRDLKGVKKADEEISTSINLNLDIRIPDSYISDSSQRLRMYKRISSARDLQELERLKGDLIDRFGAYPAPVENLFRYARLRQEALRLQIQSIERNKDQVYFRFVDQSHVDPQRLLQIVKKNRRASFSPGGVLALQSENPHADALFDSIHRILEQIRA